MSALPTNSLKVLILFEVAILTNDSYSTSKPLTRQVFLKTIKSTSFSKSFAFFGGHNAMLISDMLSIPFKTLPPFHPGELS